MITQTRGHLKILFRLIFSLFIGISYGLSVNFDPTHNRHELSFLSTLDIEESFLNDKAYKDLKNNYFLYKKGQLVSILSNASIYYPLIKEILIKEGVPKELVYVAMAESAFKNSAFSSARAVGMWQFMPATAKMYGLRVDEYVDERRDPIKSTYAAIRYLKHLKARFGKWYLAVMAYNCGGGRLNWAIRKAGSDKLEDLLAYVPASKRYRCPSRKRRWQKCQPLPRETRTYIRKIVAMATLAENERTLTGLDASHLLNRGSSYPMATVEVAPGTTLSEISSAIDIDEAELKNLNASLKYNFVPPYVDKFTIYIPYNKLAQFRQDFKPSSDNQKFIVYRVKKGDTLSGIGSKFGLSYTMIQDFNNIRGGLISINQKLVIPITKGSVVKYQVKKGDTLSTIAKKYRTTVDKILKFNNRKKKIIYVGEYLEIKR